LHKPTDQLEGIVIVWMAKLTLKHSVSVLLSLLNGTVSLDSGSHRMKRTVIMKKISL
jgi:hypothetical protein